MPEPVAQWIDLGDAVELQRRPLQQVFAGRTPIALVCRDGEITALSGTCNHVGGPLGEGTLEGDYVVCPWHQWRFHRKTGEGEPGFEADRVPTYRVRVRDGRLEVDLRSRTKRRRAPHEPHPLARPIVRRPGPLRLVGISTTAMDRDYPRYSTSDALLQVALDHARGLGCEIERIGLDELRFEACRGYYSKSAHACTWPCSITQMDPTDQMDRVYEAFVHWADAVMVATPIRWGNASHLYYKMVERMNCIQNQETIADRYLLRNKTVSLIVTGGQDNVQGVAGQMLTFFSELGCQFPQFPFIAHSRGWSAEDMETNVRTVQQSEALRAGARALAERTLAMAKLLVSDAAPLVQMARGGRKAHLLDPANRSSSSG
jgi:nitrite reductase/ring-hydroxylating ferredoxin subunit/multimeric flavodoxin WrbA